MTQSVYISNLSSSSPKGVWSVYYIIVHREGRKKHPILQEIFNVGSKLTLIPGATIYMEIHEIQKVK